jgi:hypothetical protein
MTSPTPLRWTKRTPRTPRQPGALKGQIVIAEDFDDTPAGFAEYTA